ncbi:MAG: NAD-dependent epimerase/dehydratase family protein [Anaerolineaceae bacterium]|nr:NAD-dependent epimerase/dehydratase family protein [Anaerolineaceae bacterium]
MIFVTGGTGFLGRHLVPALCQAGYPVRILTRDPAANTWLNQYPQIQVVAGDLLDKEVVQQGVAGCRYVIHAGGRFRFWGNERDFLETNARGSEHVMAAAQAAGVERVIHISTAAVIGNPDPDSIIDESYPPNPADPYQKSKLRAEQVAITYYEKHQLPVVILRPGAYYGPLGTYAFNRLFFKDPMRGIIMQINGGRYIIFPAYIADVAQGILKALELSRLGEIYHICGDWISHKEAFDIVCEEAQLHWPRLPIPGWLGIQTARMLEAVSVITRSEPFWPLNLRSYVYNNWRISSEKARQELGFTPISFREGARRTIAWYRAGQPDCLPELECS